MQIKSAQETTLLASVVLFKELYDSDKDIYDVIAEFIKAAMIFEKKWAFNATEATQLLSTEFGLSIPEAVVATTLRKRLANRDQILSHDGGMFSLVDESIKKTQSIADEFQSLKSQQRAILDSLFLYIESALGPLTDNVRDEVSKAFCDYLFDANLPTKYADYVSSFIIEHQGQPDFTGSLNAVREGSVLYNGVRYTPNVNDLNTWKTKLTLFLDTEHLFNAIGYNGVLYEQLFKDLYTLANEVRTKGAKLIALKYFSESRKEVENFFYVAELIVEGRAVVDPSKPAMMAILDGCKSRSDVVEKKAAFFSRLDTLGISEEGGALSAVEYQYNIGGERLLSELKENAKENEREFNEEKCVNVLSMFSKINALRKGDNKRPFEEIGYILVSGSSFTRFLAFYAGIRGGDHDAPFATDLDFVTNKLWFKLRKGLAKQFSTPQSLNVLARAQVVLSSQINTSIAEKFEKVQADFASGRLPKEEAEYLSNELRTKTSLPERITPDQIRPALEFLTEDSYERHLREKSLLLDKVKEGDDAKAELAAIRAKERADKERRFRQFSVARASIAGCAIFGIIGGAYYILYLLLVTYDQGRDSPLTVFGIVLSFIVGTGPLVLARKIVRSLRDWHAAEVQRKREELEL